MIKAPRLLVFLMSSGSESDEEYVPGEPEQLSEEESAAEETELQYENEQDHKAKKRKANSKGKGRKKVKTRNNETEIVEEEEEKVLEDKVDPEEEKKREDDLWAKFLEGTDTKPKSVKEMKDLPILTDTASKTSANIGKTKPKEDDKERERRIFDFAGEKIVVENNVVVDKIKSDDSSPSASQTQAPSIKKGGGISSILNQINKKNKLSTLEKSKLDWNTFKKDEGIEEEIVSHNKGKAGYLDRRDFLERTEYRQYEIERDLRMSRRSNR